MTILSMIILTIKPLAIMKKSVLSICAIAAAFLLAGCQKEINNEEVNLVEATHSVVFTADKIIDTRTAIASEGSDVVSYKWIDGDDSRMYITESYQNGEETTVNVGTVRQMTLSNNDKTATFNVTFNGSAPTGSVTYRAVYGGSFSSNNHNPSIPDEQNPLPNSFDPSADIMVSEEIVKSSRDENPTFKFNMSRKVSVNKMTLKGLDPGEVVSSVSFESDQRHSGTYLVNSDSYNTTDGRTKLTFIYTTNNTVPSSGEFPVYFTTRPVTNAAFTVTAVTDQHRYRKTPASTISFAVGKVRRFGVNLEGCEQPEGRVFTLVTSPSELQIGADVVIAANGSKNIAMSNTQGTNNRPETDATKSSDYSTITITDQVQVFTLLNGATTGTYAFSFDNDGTTNYLYAASSTSNWLRSQENLDENASWTVAISNNEATITAQGSNTHNILQYNSSGNIFSCYESGQQTVYLYQAEAQESVATPTFSPEAGEVNAGTEVTISTTTPNATIYYTTNGDTPTTSSSVYSGPITITANVTIKAIAVKEDYKNSAVASARYTIPGSGWIETSLGSISEGDVFVIVGVKNDQPYAMANNNGTTSAPSAVEVVINGDKLASDPADYLKWNLTVTNSSYIFYPDGDATNRLYCINNNNGLRVGTGDNPEFTVSNDYLFNTGQSRYIGVYVSDDTKDWRSYTSINNNITGETFKFYKYVAAPDTRDPAPISWNPTSGTATMSANGTTTSLPSLTNGDHLAVTYASSNPEVATIASDGTVTIVSGGETEISATYDGSDSNAPYKTTTVSYTLTVTDSRPTAATPTFTPGASAVASGTTVTISCETSGATIYYTTGNSTFSVDNWTLYSEPISITTGCTLKAIAIKNNYKNSEVASATYTISESVNNTSTEANPYTVAEVTELISGLDQSTTVEDVYVKGIISEITNAYSSQYHNITFNISADGLTTGTQFKIYRIGAESASTFQVGDGVELVGTAQNYGGTNPQLNANISAITILHKPTFSPNGGSFTTNSQTVTIEAASGASILYSTDGSSPATTYSGPLTLTATTTVKAVATMGVVTTGVTEATFTKNDGSPTLQYTLDGTVTGGTSGYADESTITQNSITWKATANTTMNPWRFGGKNLTAKNRAVYSTTPISSNISSIEVESGTATLTVNSLTITVHNSANDAANGTNAIATKTETTSTSITKSTVTLTNNTSSSWAGKYYRIVYNVTTAGSSNSYIQFLSAKFYGI